MTTRSEPGDGLPDPGLSAIMSERRQLINLTYRLLGSLAEAEDAVQETYARWYALSRQQQEAIESPGAWLTTVASRICLNLLSSARARRETYVGEWIPEPLPERTEWITGRSGGTTIDPADRVTLDESVNMAFLVVLESMTPAERVAFILHDVFGYPFAEVAEIVGRTPAACRQLASSARRRIRASQAPASSDSPAGRHRQGLQGGMGSQGHRRPHRPARPRRHGDRRRRRPRQHLPAPHRRRRADRARLGRNRQPGAQHVTIPGAHGQRPARPGGSARRRHRDGVRVRRRRRPDQAHLGSTQPRETPALDDGLTRVSLPSGPLRAAATQPSLPSQAGRATTAPPEKGGQPAAASYSNHWPDRTSGPSRSPRPPAARRSLTRRRRPHPHRGEAPAEESDRSLRQNPPTNGETVAPRTRATKSEPTRSTRSYTIDGKRSVVGA